MRHALWLLSALTLAPVPAGPALAAHEGRAGVGILPFSAQEGSEIPEIGLAISELLKNLLAGELSKPERRDCKVAAVATGRERDEVLKEQALQQSPLVDPASRVPTGHLIPVSMTVTGTATATATTTSWTAEVKDSGGATIATATGRFSADATHAEIDGAVGQTAADLAAQLCRPWRASGGGSGVKITPARIGSIHAPFQLTGSFPGGQVTFSYVPTGAQGGTHSYGAAGSGVTAAGKGSYTLTRQGESLILRQQEQGCTAPVGACRATTLTIRLDPEPR